MFTGSTEREVRLYVMGSHPWNCKHPAPSQCERSELNESENEASHTVVRIFTRNEVRWANKHFERVTLDVLYTDINTLKFY